MSTLMLLSRTLDGGFTFPFNVVAANSLASGVALEDERMECVDAQASGYCMLRISMALLREIVLI